MNKAALAVTGALLLGGLAAPVTTAAPAQAATSYACDMRTYQSKFKHGAFKITGPRLSQFNTHSYAPGYSREVTLSVKNLDEYTSGFQASTTISASTGNKWIAEASVEASATFERSGSSSTEKSKTVTDTVVNNTRYNATFVFYRGSYRTFTAATYYSRCVQDGGFSDPNKGHTQWVRARATLRSFSEPSDGVLMCGAGTRNVNAVGRLALKTACQR